MSHDVAQSHDNSDEAVMAEIADRYCERLERGEDPDIEQIAGEHPQLAEPIRQVLTALKVLRRSDSAPVATQSMPNRGAHFSDSAIDPTGRVGDFQIRREIGRGGMGVVYEAEQISLDRSVALKILPFAAALDPTRLERFRYEAQAAARLHHSNIVPVYSVGCERGVYYYAMQYIEGQSLARVIRQWQLDQPRDPSRHDEPDSQPGGTVVDPPTGHSLEFGAGIHDSHIEKTAVPKTAEADTRNQATMPTAPSTGSRNRIEAVVNLSIQAAAALQAAHEMGVVHRDIKPANLLVDVRGHLWVTDFGLARFRDDSNLTATGHFIGTLRYMSPEQAVSGLGTVDHRTDIYSLAATIYEMLTLVPVLTGETQADMQHNLQHREPRKPRKLNPAIPADLETIVLKGLSKDAGERYASAREMAEDFQRFLQHEPIRAKRPTLVERAVKWSRRHRSIVASAVALLLMAVIGLSATTVLLTREQTRTEAALAELESALESEAAQRLAAQQNFYQAHEMLEYFMQIGEEELTENADLPELRRQMLRTGLEYYQQFINQHQDDPHVRAELASSHYNIARILHATENTAAATAALEDACAIQEQLVRDFPEERKYRWRLISLYRDLGVLEGRDRLNILSHPAVQKHLELASLQVDSVDRFLADEDGIYHEIRDFSDPRKMRAELTRHASLTVTAIRLLLTPAQHDRLDQICLQERGIRALTDADTIEALQMTSSQQQDVRYLLHHLRREYWKNRKRGDHDRSKHDRDAHMALLDGILTSSQHRKWRQMVGEPFDVEISCRYRHRDRKSTQADRSASETKQPKSESKPTLDDIKVLF